VIYSFLAHLDIITITLIFYSGNVQNSACSVFYIDNLLRWCCPVFTVLMYEVTPVLFFTGLMYQEARSSFSVLNSAIAISNACSVFGVLMN
jgi:hypothetical protein